MARMRKHVAFTLIELLVVVAIIGLLISILLPSLRNAREEAKDVICKSNQHQWSMANHMYADESKDIYVPIRSVDGRYWMWNTLFRKLTHAPPINRGKAEFLDGVKCSKLEPDAVGSGGLIRNWGGWNRSPQGWTAGLYIRRNRLKNPWEKIQWIDATDWHVDWRYAGSATRWDIYRHRRLWQVAYRHRERAGAVHFDGHAALFSKAEAYPSTFDEQKRIWFLNPN